MKTPLLVLDNLGIQIYTKYAIEKVFNVIDTRIQNGNPTIITTNLPLNHLQNYRELSHNRIYSRILDMCVPVMVKGDDRRMINARVKKQIFLARLREWEAEFQANRW